jgi:hypothetical protein
MNEDTHENDGSAHLVVNVPLGRQHGCAGMSIIHDVDCLSQLQHMVKEL